MQRSASDPLLDAVVAEVMAYGVRRATATSVAQRAGVSRMTVHRRGGLQQLLLDAISREFDQTVHAVAGPESGEPVRARLSAGVASTIATLNASPLITALHRHDPELVVPYLVDRLGHSQQTVLAVLVEAIRLGQEDGSVREVDPDLAGHVLLMALQNFVISAGIIRQVTDPQAVLREVSVLVDSYLAPAATS
ncbi:TetR/AcrR family transcriptional regulator [Luteipulveratus flavus]|uniref:TetR/AcrR family transcriptional regulator n=1 Tax=Luteipulveratus flavus TaxID=3031728 RepID=A0ABT6CB25_9MICO|nr:TetR/AcrR family transcriptional regulator [Luteipulveratus sp. YIM 133296]MDF8266086.1 TetR/AcrR family transcriptional regulator [Luteipulveratus sp. YIM 133296]